MSDRFRKQSSPTDRRLRVQFRRWNREIIGPGLIAAAAGIPLLAFLHFIVLPTGVTQSRALIADLCAFLLVISLLALHRFRPLYFRRRATPLLLLAIVASLSALLYGAMMSGRVYPWLSYFTAAAFAIVFVQLGARVSLTFALFAAFTPAALMASSAAAEDTLAVALIGGTLLLGAGAWLSVRDRLFFSGSGLRQFRPLRASWKPGKSSPGVKVGLEAGALSALMSADTKGVVLHDKSGRIVQANECAAQILGLTLDQLFGRTSLDPRWRTIGEDGGPLPGEDHPAMRSLRTGVAVSDFVMGVQRPDGETSWILVNSVPVTQPVQGIVGAVATFSERDLPPAVATAAPAISSGDWPVNRRGLIEQLGFEINRPLKAVDGLACLMIGLPGVERRLTDRGEQEAAELIRQIGARIVSKLPAGAVFGRYSLIEFAVFHRLTAEGAFDLAEELCAAIANAEAAPFNPPGVKPVVGIALHPEDGVDAATLLARADLAMFAAQRPGAAPVQFYSADTRKRIRRGQLIAARFQRALQADRIRFHCMPVYSLSENRLRSVEALVRWPGPRQVRLPADFLRAIEATPGARSLFVSMLRECARFILLLATDPLGPRAISLNLSAEDLKGDDLAATIAAVLAEFSLPPQRLELEIRESVCALRPELVETRVREFRRLGLSVCIDGFGLGAASLQMLQRLPVNRIKLDRALISQVTERSAAAGLVKATIAAAHALGIVTVGVGVERSEQEEFLRMSGCDEAQGYLYGRPAPPSEILRHPGAKSAGGGQPNPR